ncbi:ATP-binding protein [Aestuariivirga litoralis]|uniref:ATP-binding protein n=1 Tax=Aestuariivirga litoralis TaxID=2650924 RepID=UPI00137B2C41|nr:DUF87 domain-containing protein [Aestuariivirga litoralis]
MTTDLVLGKIAAVNGTTATVRLGDDIAGRENRPAREHTVVNSAAVGSLVKIKVEKLVLFGSVGRISPRGPGDVIEAEISFIGEGAVSDSGELTEFRRGVSRYPFPGDDVYGTSYDDWARIFRPDGKSTIPLGIVHPTVDITALLSLDQLLSKHFAVLGSTGVGKSTSVAALLHKVLEAAPNGHVVLIDPHGEYASAFRTNSIHLDVDSLKLPYWLMNFEEHAEAFLTGEGSSRERDRDILGKCLLTVRQKNYLNIKIDKVTADSPIPYFISDLLEELEKEAGKLEKAADASRYIRLKLKIEEMVRDPRYGFMFGDNLITDSMGDLLSTILRIPTQAKPLTIIDVSGMPSEIVSVVVAMIARLVFDYSIWSRGERQVPILLVCEEAQRYLPREDSVMKPAAQRNFERIAKEGRKHGISLGLISQRPSDLSESVLSQCGTLLVLRLTTERDQNFIKSAVPDWAHGVVSSISSLRNRECIVFGEAVPIPVRVGIAFLEESRRPSSNDPRFTEAWNAPQDADGMVGRVIQRWRNQRHELE